MMRNLLGLAISSALILGSLSPAFCAGVTGIASNTRGNPVIGVQIKVRAFNGNVLGDAVTDSHGSYAVGGLAPGTYVFVLNPLATGYKGGNAVAHLDSNGLIVNWRVSKIGQALAMASPPQSDQARHGGSQIADDPFGYSPGEFAGLVGLGVGAAAAGIVGGYGVAGGFSGGKPVSSSR